ncbi:MAG: ATP-binding protein [Lachnospiraceae bacterium]|nr:ATP-binding protein [Lachnospiraceae bacterium]
MKELTVEAKTENIDIVTELVESQLTELDCSMRSLVQISVAIDELFGNIAHYAYKPGTGDVTVRIDVEEPRTAVITFIDGGKPYNPLEAEEPDVTLSAEERKVGGLGIFLVKKTMDDMRYEYRDGKNVLQIKKKI